MPVEDPHRVVCHLDSLLAERGMTLAVLAETRDRSGIEKHDASSQI